MLAGIDTLVIDLQDVGVRFYTYQTTMALRDGGGGEAEVVRGDSRSARIRSTAGRSRGRHREPSNRVHLVFPDAGAPRHDDGRAGEAVQRGKQDQRRPHRRSPIENWRRDYWYDDTGLSWINPSPNMRNLNQATLYPGIGAIEYSNVSVGRGTDQPFEQFGAPWIDGPRLSAALNARKLPGIRFYPITFTPKSSKYANEECQGVFMVITNRSQLQPVRVGLEIAAALVDDVRRANTTSRRRGGCLGLPIRSSASSAVRIRPRWRRGGRLTKRAGAACARNICCIGRPGAGTGAPRAQEARARFLRYISRSA